MRPLIGGLVLSIAATLTACGGAATSGTATNNPATVPAGSFYEIRNNSSYDIHYIYMSSTSESVWGPDQLDPTQILGAGQTVRFGGVPCDTYDLRLVDEDGDECIQRGIEICQNTTLVIQQADLLRCEGY